MKQKKINIQPIFAFLVMLVMMAFTGCSDDDSFTTSTSARLTFSADTISMDTVFATVPTTTRTFWAYNNSGDGLRCTSVRLERGNQSGFRVNVDGTYLGENVGYQTSDVEIRKNDSIRIFVEFTSATIYQDEMRRIEDNLVFTLESGVEQKVNLNATAWRADMMNNVVIVSDSVISSTRPIIIYGGITINEGATLTIASGTTLYFHSDAGINVYGRLICEGESNQNVVLRGDRIDNMFDYLPYDRVSGQWQGIHIYSTSKDNVLNFTDLHSAFNGIIVDSTNIDQTSLTLNASTIHNCQGYGLRVENANITLINSQISNVLNDCLYISGGCASLNACTLAQYYPFDAGRGVALRFSNSVAPLTSFLCINSLITGYADDELMGEPNEGINFVYNFDHCVIRTPEITTEDSIYFNSVTFENIEDTISYGKKHFVLIDTDNLKYDFRLAKTSGAIGKANIETSPLTDRNATPRDSLPDIGAFEYVATDE